MSSYECNFELIMFTDGKWKFTLFLNLLAAFIQAGKLDGMGACRELFKNKKYMLQCKVQKVMQQVWIK